MLAPKLECQIIQLLGIADHAMTAYRGAHGAHPTTSCLGLRSRAPKVEVLLLANTIFVHQHSALVHELGGAHVNLVDNIVHNDTAHPYPL